MDARKKEFRHAYQAARVHTERAKHEATNGSPKKAQAHALTAIAISMTACLLANCDATEEAELADENARMTEQSHG